MPIEKEDVVDAIEEMNSPLRHQYEAIRDLFSRAVTTDARARREVGASILEIKTAPGKYGTGGVALLARALGRDVATLYRYAQVAACWSTGELEKILSAKDPAMQSLSWSHLVELAAVDSVQFRKALLKEALECGLSVRELVGRIREGRPQPTETPDEETRLSANLRELAATFERFQKSGLEWDEASLTRLAKPSREECTPETLRLLERALKAQSMTADACHRNVERLTAARAHVAGVIAHPAPRAHAEPGRLRKATGLLLAGGGGKRR